MRSMQLARLVCGLLFQAWACVGGARVRVATPHRAPGSQVAIPVVLTRVLDQERRRHLATLPRSWPWPGPTAVQRHSQPLTSLCWPRE